MQGKKAGAIQKNKLIGDLHAAGSDVITELPELAAAVRYLEAEQLSVMSGSPVPTIAGTPSHDEAMQALKDAADARGCR